MCLTKSVPGISCDILHEQIPFSWHWPKAPRQAFSAWLILEWIKPESVVHSRAVEMFRYITVLPGSHLLNVLWYDSRGNSQCRIYWLSHDIYTFITVADNICVSDCWLTEGAAFVLCAFHGAIGQHLEVEAVSAVEPGDDALQLGLCRANTGLNTL